MVHNVRRSSRQTRSPAPQSRSEASKLSRPLTTILVPVRLSDDMFRQYPISLGHMAATRAFYNRYFNEFRRRWQAASLIYRGIAQACGSPSAFGSAEPETGISSHPPTPVHQVSYIYLTLS